MKHSICLIALSLVMITSFQLNAQQAVLIKKDSTQKIQTLFQNKIKSFGLSVSPTLQFGSMGPQAGVSLALHLNNKWEVGGSFTRSLRHDRDDIAIDPKQGQQFHALSIAYTAKANKLFHLSFPLLIGAITTHNQDTPIGIATPGTQSNPIRGGHGGIREGGMFWNGPKSLGVQPGIQLELNVLRNLRVFTGANYRFAFGENSTDAMQGFVGTVGVKLGVFDRGFRLNKK